MILVGQERVPARTGTQGFITVRSGPLRFVVNEPYSYNSTLQAIIENPEHVLHSAKDVLKDDHRSKVVRIGGLVLKRFNRRSRWHGLRDMFRISDAARTWDRAWRLLRVGLPTAEPIAYADRRILGFSVCSYLVMRAIPRATDARGYLRKTEDPPPELIRELAGIVARFHNAGFHWNRDINDRNILVTNANHIYLIDVDGVRVPRRCTPARQRQDLQTLHNALSVYPHFRPRHTAIFIHTYRRMRRGPPG
jgi:hypothetical protein